MHSPTSKTHLKGSVSLSTLAACLIWHIRAKPHSLLDLSIQRVAHASFTAVFSRFAELGQSGHFVASLVTALGVTDMSSNFRRASHRHCEAHTSTLPYKYVYVNLYSSAMQTQNIHLFVCIHVYICIYIYICTYIFPRKIAR